MHRRIAPTTTWKLLAATLLAAACSDVAGPPMAGLRGPLLAVGLDQENGTMATGGSFAALPKGFNPKNPGLGSAVVATFMWTGSTSVTSVTDHLTNGTPVGNTYTKVDSVTAGGITMVTYVATNIQNFPNNQITPTPITCDLSASPPDADCYDQDRVLVVRATLTTPVTDAAITLTAYAGVETSLAAALGDHRSASGSGNSAITVSPGTVAADSGAVVYATVLGTPIVGHDPRSASAGALGPLEADKQWSIRTADGSVTPQWNWFFSSSQPGTWLATALVLNPAGGGGPPPTGNLAATTSTTGSNLDPDGYTVTVDGGASQAVGINATVTFAGLSAGDHSVALSGVASNCTVSGATPRTVNVPSGGTGSTTFAVTCSATTGSLSVATSTSGSSLDPDGYSVSVDGGAGQAIAINGNVTFNNLSAGNHTVSLSGVAGNCTVSGSNPRTVSVPSGGTGSTTFSVTCSSPPGNLTANTSTTGSSLDPNGYTVAVDGGAGQAIAINSSLTFTNLSAGNHSVSLSGVASNCTLSGSNPRTVSVPAGGTGSTTFSVTCTSPLGNLAVNTSTTGSSLDPNGYTVSVDGGAGQAIGINSSLTFTNLTPGNHSVSLSGVASNCTLSGSNPRTIAVPSGGTASTTFSVNCVTPNTAPVVNAGPDQTALTGLLFSESWSFTDPNNGPWSFTIDWGDGTTTTGSKTAPGSFSNGHTYITILPRSYTIRITVTDSMGASHTDTKVVTVLLL